MTSFHSGASLARPSAIIHFRPPGHSGPEPLRHAFGQPREILSASTLADVLPVLHAVHDHARQGRWCVGYVRYEAAPAFDPAMAVHPPDGPLAWFSVHDEALPWPDPAPGDPAADPHLAWEAPLTRARFDEAISTIHAAIARGEVYQVNFTASLAAAWKVPAPHRVDASLRLFEALQRSQPHAYAAWIDTGAEQVLSVSPELFFDWHGDGILTRPMKGTAARGTNPQDDAAMAAALRSSAKERAENVMIVDLLRNDLSRIAQPHSVRAERLFELTALPTVWQMTSDVVARTRAGTTLGDVFRALFPCGSVTGAPKLSAMRLIHDLEERARGIYCGAVGVVRPGGSAIFNVPIRTVTLHADHASCGIGSGVTSDARAEGEWREWRSKRAFLHRASAPFEILETLALEQGKAGHGRDHLLRMAAAAAHFGYPFDPAQAMAALEHLARTHPDGRWRVRLLLDRAGRLDAQAHPLPDSPRQVRLQLAPRALEDAGSEFVRFKTTRREHYDAFSPTQPGIFDTILWNERGELTECTRGNIALEIDGRWVTPAASCGLLPGIARARWLAEGRLIEAVVSVEDLCRGARVAFINSLRGWIEAQVVLDAAAGTSDSSRPLGAAPSSPPGTASPRSDLRSS